MSNIIGIVNYGIAGNIHSIKKAVERAGGNTLVINKPSDFSLVDKLIIPGVGSFKDGMQELENDNFINPIQEFSKPILGICLGMQLLSNLSEEGKEKGLGWIDAKTVKFELDDKSLSIPHMGWNKTNPTNTKDIYQKLGENRFYFVHTYHVVCNDEKNILATANYGKEFTCSIYKDNIYGVQFHPEKSHKFGMQLLKNFGEL